MIASKRYCVTRFGSPEYVRLLAISELRGITAAEVLALRRKFLYELHAAPAQQERRLTRMVNPTESRLGEFASV